MTGIKLLIGLSSLCFSYAAFGGTIPVTASLGCSGTGTAGFFSIEVSGVCGPSGGELDVSFTFTAYVTVYGGTGTGTAHLIPGGLDGFDCYNELSAEFGSVDCLIAAAPDSPGVYPIEVDVPFVYGESASVILTESVELGIGGVVPEETGFAYWDPVVQTVANPGGGLNESFSAVISDEPISPEPGTLVTCVAGLLFLSWWKVRAARKVQDRKDIFAVDLEGAEQRLRRQAFQSRPLPAGVSAARS